MEDVPNHMVKYWTFLSLNNTYRALSSSGLVGSEVEVCNAPRMLNEVFQRQSLKLH